jgi:hypothetical protein
LDCFIELLFAILSDRESGFRSDSIDFEQLFKELLLFYLFKGEVDDSFFIFIQVRMEEKISFFFFTSIKNLNASGVIP